MARSTTDYVVLVKTLKINGSPLATASIILDTVLESGIEVTSQFALSDQSGQATFHVVEGNYSLQIEFPGGYWGWTSGAIGYYLVVEPFKVSSDMTVIVDPRINASRLSVDAFDLQGKPLNERVSLSSLGKRLPHAHVVGNTESWGNLVCYATPGYYHVVLDVPTYLLWKRSVNLTKDVSVVFVPTPEDVATLNLTVDPSAISGIPGQDVWINFYFDFYESNGTFGGWARSFCFTNPQFSASQIVYVQSGFYNTKLRIEVSDMTDPGKNYRVQFVNPPLATDYSPILYIQGGVNSDVTFGGSLNANLYTNASTYSRSDSVMLFLNVTDSHGHRLSRLDGGEVTYGNLTITDPSGNMVKDKMTFLPDTMNKNPYVFQIPYSSEFGAFICSVEVDSPSLNFYGGKLLVNSTFIYQPTHDIALTSITPSKNVVAEGHSVSVNATILNQGDFSETFDVTFYANGTKIETLPVALENGASTNLSFTWNTSGFAYGNYTISAVADTVPNEADATDNNCTRNTPVHIGVPGDISGPTLGVYDGKCDMRDVSYLIVRFNTKPDSANWNANTDINNDATVNMRDISIAILNFNQHE